MTTQLYLSPCGCTIVGNGTAKEPLRIAYCPGHAAAPEMLAALKGLTGHARNNGDNGKAFDDAVAAIQAAEANG